MNSYVKYNIYLNIRVILSKSHVNVWIICVQFSTHTLHVSIHIWSNSHANIWIICEQIPTHTLHFCWFYIVCIHIWYNSHVNIWIICEKFSHIYIAYLYVLHGIHIWSISNINIWIICEQFPTHALHIWIITASAH